MTPYRLRTALLLLVAGALASCTPSATALPTVEVQKTPVATSVATAEATVPSTGPAAIAFVAADEIGNFETLKLAMLGGETQTLAVDSANPDALTSCFPAPAWSPDGRYLVAGRRASVEAPDQEMVVIDTQQGNAVTLIPGAGYSAAWAPDSARLFHTRPLDWNVDTLPAPQGDEGLWAWDMATGQDVQVFKPFEGYPLGRIDIAPDGTRVSMHSAQFEGAGQFALVDADGANLKLVDVPVGSYDWSPDSQWLVFDEVTYIPQPPAALKLMDRNGENQKTLFEDPERVALAPRWSPDGQTIAFIQSTGMMVEQPMAQVWLIGADGQNLRQLSLPALTEAQWLDWAPDSQALVVSGREGVYLAPLTGEPMFLGAGGCPAWKP